MTRYVKRVGLSLNVRHEHGPFGPRTDPTLPNVHLYL
jgi:hypothetical protein